MNCKCTFAQSIVGDGCDICNPEKARELISMSFEEWFEELKRIAYDYFCYTEESIDSFEPIAWRFFYDEGRTPMNAMIEHESLE